MEEFPKLRTKELCSLPSLILEGRHFSGSAFCTYGLFSGSAFCTYMLPEHGAGGMIPLAFKPARIQWGESPFVLSMVSNIVFGMYD